jgi:hypothetical protein
VLGIRGGLGALDSASLRRRGRDCAAATREGEIEGERSFGLGLVSLERRAGAAKVPGEGQGAAGEMNTQTHLWIRRARATPQDEWAGTTAGQEGCRL